LHRNKRLIRKAFLIQAAAPTAQWLTRHAFPALHLLTNWLKDDRLHCRTPQAYGPQSHRPSH
jgi:hypothetical protein